MKSITNSLIIGVDAGYGNMKTARSIFPTGLIAMDTEPMFDGDILKYNGVWYRIGEGHKAFVDDKTEDDEFTFEEFKIYVDEALVWMQIQLETNSKIRELIEEGDIE